MAERYIPVLWMRSILPFTKHNLHSKNLHSTYNYICVPRFAWCWRPSSTLTLQIKNKNNHLSSKKQVIISNRRRGAPHKETPKFLVRKSLDRMARRNVNMRQKNECQEMLAGLNMLGSIVLFQIRATRTVINRIITPRRRRRRMAIT